MSCLTGKYTDGDYANGDVSRVLPSSEREGLLDATAVVTGDDKHAVRTFVGEEISFDTMSHLAKRACHEEPTDKTDDDEVVVARDSLVRPLTDLEALIVSKNGPGRWNHNCWGEDCGFAHDSSAEWKNTGYILDCAHCRHLSGTVSSYCEQCLYECDLCGDFVCRSCTYKYDKSTDPTDMEDCKCFKVFEDNPPGFLCPKHWRICIHCEESKCLCAFSGKSRTCRECP